MESWCWFRERKYAESGAVQLRFVSGCGCKYEIDQPQLDKNHGDGQDQLDRLRNSHLFSPVQIHHRPDNQAVDHQQQTDQCALRQHETAAAISARLSLSSEKCHLMSAVFPDRSFQLPIRFFMSTQIFYDTDANLELLNGKTIAIIGYGSQGAAHAQNVRDSGCRVIVGQRDGGPGFAAAKRDSFDPLDIAAAAEQADLINILLPDEIHGDIFREQILPGLNDGNIVMTCHGFSFHYGHVLTPAGVDRLLVAPKGQGHMVRSEYLRGGGVPCLIAIDDDTRPETLQLGLAYAAALGGTKAGVLLTTIAAETETDLFGEQAVLCGGVTGLVQAGFETLVEAGYQPELAYFECLHELKIIVDLMHNSGIRRMRESISNTAEYGDYTRGPRVIDDRVKATMKEILAEIQSGQFARQFIQQHKNGDQELNRLRADQSHPLIEQVGAKLRSLMPWLQNDLAETEPND